MLVRLIHRMLEEKPFVNPIDPEKVAENPGLLPYAHHVGSGIIRPDDMGKVKSNALLAMEQQTNMQLKQIEEQIKLLYNQAKDISDRTNISVWIYQSDFGFDPLVGHTYHLYQKANGKHFLSMVGPNEWGRSKADREYVATVRLLADHTWDILERAENSGV